MSCQKERRAERRLWSRFTFCYPGEVGGHLCEKFSQRPAMDTARELDQWVKKMKCSGATGLDITSFPEIKVTLNNKEVNCSVLKLMLLTNHKFSSKFWSHKFRHLLFQGWTGLFSSGTWESKSGPFARWDPMQCDDGRSKGVQVILMLEIIADDHCGAEESWWCLRSWWITTGDVWDCQRISSQISWGTDWRDVDGCSDAGGRESWRWMAARYC